MKKPQWITVAAGILLVVAIYSFGKTIPPKKKSSVENQHSENDGHDHGAVPTISFDSLLTAAKLQIKPEQVTRLNALENSISRGDVKNQQLQVYHQLAHFWRDSAHKFEPYAWYEAESARLENSEKTLTFAAHLFLENLQNEADPKLRKWKALQAKDLFERSLTLNPANDSAKVGIGACYIFGGISVAPMEGISKIREVVEKDSTNLYAQTTLVKGLVISGQFDKAITRLQTIHRLQPSDAEVMLLIADLYERIGEKGNAIKWYEKTLELKPPAELRKALEDRIAELKK